MSIFKGGREIQLMHVGRGHTAGDVVVYLPHERLLCTGDLLTAGLPYAGHAFADARVATLEQLKTLDFDIIIPGHGEVLNGTDQITIFNRTSATSGAK